MRLAALAFALVALPATALAQDLAPLDQLQACRLDPATVSLAFITDGSACQQTGEAAVDAVDGGTAMVSIPTTSTAEMCTMQVVKMNFAGIVPVPEDVTVLDVQVLNPDGEAMAAGEAEVTPNGPDCLPPEAEAPVAQ